MITQGEGTSRLIYEYDTIHAVKQQELQAKYVGKYQESLNSIGVEEPNQNVTGKIQLIGSKGIKIREVNSNDQALKLNLQICWFCRRLLIPGLTLKVRIRYPKHIRAKAKGKNGQNNKFPSRILVYKCLGCGGEVQFLDALKDAGEQKSKKRQYEGAKEKGSSNGQKLKQVSNAHGNKRKHRKKRSALGRLLDKKKEEDRRRTAGGNGLNLFDFLH